MNKPKKNLSKTLMGETGYLCICFLFRPLPHVTGTHCDFSDHLQGSPPALSSTPTLGFFCFFECICIQFFSSLTCDLWHTMPRQGSLSVTCDLPDVMLCQGSLTHIPREAEDFPGGNNHSGHVPLPTLLA